VLPVAGLVPSLTQTNTTTDQAGRAQTFVNPVLLQPTVSFASFTIRAELTSGGSSTDFVVTFSNAEINTGTPFVTGELLSPQRSQLPLSAASGSQGTVPVQIRLSATGFQGGPVPLIRLEIRDTDPGSNTPGIHCLEPLIFTDAQGMATCTPVFSGPPGDGYFQIIVGGGQLIVFGEQSFRVLPGASTPGTGLRFVSLPPCRIMETRPEYNFQGRTGAFGPPFMLAGETRTLTVPNSSVCSIPATAKTYVLNVTLIPRGPVDFVTIWPGGETRPSFWTVRSPDAQIVANGALVKPGPGGTIQVYASHNTDVIIDISGYFADYNPQGTNLVYYPLTPCRLIETRALYRPQFGPYGPPSLQAGQPRRFKFLGNPYCSVPTGAVAYSVTLTAIPQGPLAFLTAWPSGQGQPNVSSINSPAGRVLANSVIIPAGGDSSIDVYAYNTADLVVDINGYFAPDDGVNGLYYYPVTQCRISDTSTSLGPFGEPIYAARSTRTVAIAGSRCAGIPATAKAFALNVTAMPGGSPMPFLTAYPTGQAQPNASILNAFQGQVVTNSAIVPAGTNGSVNIYVFERTHVAVEVAGFFSR
jgi:hypothetical protein